MEFAERLCVRQMGPGRDRYTINEPIGGDLTQPGQCIAPFQSQAQELADRFPKRSHGQGQDKVPLNRIGRRRFQH